MKMLDNLGIKYITQYPLCIDGKKYEIDFFIPKDEKVNYDMYLEVDGLNHFQDVFHNQEYQVQRDNTINRWMIKNKQNFLRTSIIDFRFEDNFRAIRHFILFGYNSVGPEVHVILFYGIYYNKMVKDTHTFFGVSEYELFKKSWLYVWKTK